MIIWSILAGVIGGIVAGMGMGGGTLTIPILTIFLKFKQITAQGINLIAFLPMSIVAIIIHMKHKLVAFKETWLLPVSGLIFSVGGAILANNISSGVLKKIFAGFLIALGIWQMIELIIQCKNDKKQKQLAENNVQNEDKI